MHISPRTHTEPITVLSENVLVWGGEKNQHSAGLPSMAVIRGLMLCYLKPCQFHFYSEICFRAQEES